jgi:hypothetical protein
MAEPIPDFTQDERQPVTRVLLERCMYVHPAHERAIERLPDGMSVVVDGGKWVSI